jgi:hypothetical protein
MEVGGQLHSPAALPPEKKSRFPLDRSWMETRAGLDRVVKRKIPSPFEESNLITPFAQPVA